MAQKKLQKGSMIDSYDLDGDNEITNEELAEYLIGMDADIVCPPHYWPKDKCSGSHM